MIILFFYLEKYMSDEATVIFGETAKPITIRGEDIKVEAIKFGQLPKALLLVQSLGAVIVECVNDNTIGEPSTILRIAALGGEDLINLVAFGIKKDRSWFDELEQDEGLELLMAFVAVNVDFFIKRVLPTLSKNTVAMNSLISQVTPS
jgi:hypothetical protein